MFAVCCAASYYRLMNTLAERLRVTREGLKHTQASLAYAVKARFPEAKVSQQSIQAIESNPDATTGYVAEIAAVLGVNTDWLALGEGPRNRQTEGKVITDPKLTIAVELMEHMSSYQMSQAIKILDTLAQPNEGEGTNG